MKNFYDVFRLGFEFECELPSSAICKVNGSYGLLKFVHDGSINVKNADGKPIEINTIAPINSENEEAQAFKDMKECAPEFLSKSKEKIFAYYNTSCGTHYHFSFKDKPDGLLWAFNCIDFEKFFLRRYVDTFNSDKFLSRISNSFCKTNVVKMNNYSQSPHLIKREAGKINLNSYSHIDPQHRYSWLNTYSITQGTGLEIRIFPFLQTYAGIAIVTEFFKKTVMDFYQLPETQNKIKLIEFYESNIKDYGIKYNKLNQLKQIIYQYLMSDSVGTMSNLSKSLTGEFRIMIASWCMKQPSLLIKNKAI